MARNRHTRYRRSPARAGVSRVEEVGGYEAPFVITPEMEAAAAEAAARDAAELDAEWAALNEAERSWFGSSFGELPEREESAGPVSIDDGVGQTVRLESAYLGSLASGETDPGAWVGIAAATPGTLGVAGDLDTRAAAPRQVLPDAGDAISQLQVIDRLAAWVASRRFAVVAAVCPDPRDDTDARGFRAQQHLVEEIAVATRTGTGTAGSLLDTARLLQGPFTPFAAALSEGLVSEAHVRVLVRGTARVTGPQRESVLTAVAQRVLPVAMRCTPTQLERVVLAAVCALDPEGEADRPLLTRASAR